jgi:hypothetical protein
MYTIHVINSAQKYARFYDMEDCYLSVSPRNRGYTTSGRIARFDKRQLRAGRKAGHEWAMHGLRLQLNAKQRRDMKHGRGEWANIDIPF